jgi:hypothetical protein
MTKQSSLAQLVRPAATPPFESICRSSTRRSRDESGSSLILAFVLLLVSSLTVLALASWVTNDLNNTSKFQNAGSLLYAAGGATQSAMWTARYTFTDSTIIGGYPCPGSYPLMSMNGYQVADWCVARTPGSMLPGTPANATRQVTFYACLISSGTGPLSANCSHPLLTAVVYFDDSDPLKPGQLNVNCTSYANQSTCGRIMAVARWKAQQASGS